MDLALLERTLAERGEPAYRARQVWEWAARGAASYDEMTTLPKALRAALAEEVPFSTLEVVTERESRDGTVKTLFRTHDGHPVEAVLMRYRDGRRSLCLSSQSGCPLTCTFCATGAMRFGRNLTASEILDQALHFRRREPVNHAVYMGMGEPFLNVDAVLESARAAPRPRDHAPPDDDLDRRLDAGPPPLRGRGRGSRSGSRSRSTRRIPTLRSELMPVNDRYPLADVLAECRRYFELRRRKVFVEYVMLAGVNDSPAHARAARRGPRRRAFQGQPHPVQPDGHVRGLVARGDRGVQGRARARADPGDRAARRAAATSRPRAASSRIGALMERVTGVGGVFFRATRPGGARRVVLEHLGVPVHGRRLRHLPGEPEHGLGAVPEDTDYWPAAKQGMVNFTVRDLDAMLAQLRAAGVEVDEKIEDLDGIGRFGWAVDPEGNRFELWEPDAALPSG